VVGEWRKGASKVCVVKMSSAERRFVSFLHDLQVAASNTRQRLSAIKG
jgi:hypothetical protein